MSYRIEVSGTNRAGCTDTVCRSQAVKILKGELRLGSWVEMPGGGHGSWKWRHWGCVSGLVIQNIRENIGTGEDEYDWDAIDGYDELNAHPDIQEKIRRVVRQGHIDAADFNGDPEYNTLGSRGIRGRKKKTAEKDGDGEDADAETNGSTPKKSASTKRGRKQADDDGPEEPPTKKVATGKKEAAANTKAKKGARKAELVEEESPPEKPTKTARPKGKRAVKGEVPAAEEQESSAPRTRGRTKRESISEAPVKEPTAAKKRGRKSAA